MFVTLDLMKSVADDEQITITGEPVRAAGWYGHTNGLHKVCISVQNFTGRVTVQAALTLTPVSSDWFSVLPDGVPYIQFPETGYVVASPSTGETSTYEFSFTSNVLWVQAIVDRSYFLPATSMPLYVGTFGLVDSITLTYGDDLGIYDYKWPAVF